MGVRMITRYVCLLVNVCLCWSPASSAICGGTFKEASGSFSSPNYPKSYPSKSDCDYTVLVAPDARTELTCKSSIEKSKGCIKDYLRLNNTLYCGSECPKGLVIEGSFTLKFHSNAKKNKPGFQCHFLRLFGGDHTVASSCTNVPYNYDEVLHKSLLFYEAQRSGDLPKSQRVKWRKDSALGDAKDADTDVQINLEGGYYDAGDYVKFGFPMAGAATVLAWGAIENRKAYEAAGEWNYMKEAVKWATDYFIKAHVSRFVFYGQVGLGDLDHSYWGRPEDMTMKRPAFKITKEKPGSDLAGETAAALAAASILFRDSDATYANLCLKHAKELYKFANDYRGVYSESIPDAENFYKSWGGYGDELAWAAVWLYRATEDTSYLTKAIGHYSDFGLKNLANEFSWAEKTPGVQVLLANLTNDKTYKTAITKFCDKIVNKKPRTPKGLVSISKWGSLRYAANVAFICLRAADQGIKPKTYRDLAKEQIHYILGDTGRSFVIGFGNNPPQRPHHASSSCPSAPKTCDWSNYQSEGPNPHVLEGALVGGPNKKDFYEDNRNDYIMNEVACDYNAGFQSAVAELRRLFCN